MKCNDCGADYESLSDMYCTLSGRGANELCRDHLDVLVCGKCAKKYIAKERK